MKVYTICAADVKIDNYVRALWVINEFKLKGYNTKKKFMEKVLNEMPDMNAYEPIRKLTLFWLFRSLDYLNELEMLAKKL